MMEYAVSAYNTAKESENKINDDAVAQRFGFRGGLVPGVDVYAYMAHLPVQAWGRVWLERGLADCRFLKPVYEGATAEVTGTAALSAAAAPHDAGTFEDVTPAEERPPADETSLRTGRWLGMRPLLVNQ